MEEAVRSKAKETDVWTLFTRDTITRSVFKPCVQACIYVYKSPFCTLQVSVVAKSLDSGARLSLNATT